MNCRDFGDVADALRRAFDRAPDLRPRPDFAERLRGQLRAAAPDVNQRRQFSRRWLMLAAGVVLGAGLAGGLSVTRSFVTVDALARDAVGDHWNCALKNRRVRMPVPLEEAAQRFDSAYRVLLTVPADELSTPDGPAQVVDRHSCAFGTRRFGHVVLRYREHLVSLLVTADKGPEGARPGDLGPHLHGGPVNGFSVASVHGARHAILLVSDLEARDLQQLSTLVSVPLLGQLVSSPTAPAPNALAALYPATSFERLPGLGVGDDWLEAK